MFEIINNTKENIENLDILNNYLIFLTEKENITNAIFNVIFVTKEEIQRINKEYRNVDKITDVISFALEDSYDKSDEVLRVLGDIYICYDKLLEQASLYNHSNLREMCFLSTHGLLHLLGYDHMIEEEEKVMFKLQEDLLNEYGIKR